MVILFETAKVDSQHGTISTLTWDRFLFLGSHLEAVQAI